MLPGEPVLPVVDEVLDQHSMGRHRCSHQCHDARVHHDDVLGILRADQVLGHQTALPLTLGAHVHAPLRYRSRTRERDLEDEFEAERMQKAVVAER